jgi:hypothetical protein
MRSDLTFARTTPELKAGFVHVSETVSTPTGELAAVGIERQRSITGDALAAFHETAAFPTWAKA